MIQEFTTEYVEILPNKEHMEQGVLYVSLGTWQSSHLCACGCSDEIITPLIRGGWSFYADDQKRPTMSPAITNNSCDSYYEINKGYAII